MNDIYNELIMEHASYSPNKRDLIDYDYKLQGHNASCGDEIELKIKLSDDKKTIADLAFTGVGCALSTSAASIMVDTLKGKSIEETKKIIEIYMKMIRREKLNDEEIKLLSNSYAFKSISNMPSRVKCATISWRALEEILKEIIDFN